jgi:hypothetical protein
MTDFVDIWLRSVVGCYAVFGRGEALRRINAEWVPRLSEKPSAIRNFR